MAKVHEEEAIEILRKFITKWGGVLAMVGASAGFIYQHEIEFARVREATSRLERDLSLLRSEWANTRAFGPGGLLDPQLRSGVDSTIREHLRTYNAELEARLKSWRRQLRQLNPIVQLPED